MNPSGTAESPVLGRRAPEAGGRGCTSRSVVAGCLSIQVSASRKLGAHLSSGVRFPFISFPVECQQDLTRAHGLPSQRAAFGASECCAVAVTILCPSCQVQFLHPTASLVSAVHFFPSMRCVGQPQSVYPSLRSQGSCVGCDE